MLVQKHSGELVPFDKSSLIQSLSKSGASQQEVAKVFSGIESNLYNKITTRKLYQLAFNELKKIRKSYAARYSLKKALRDLGPDGYNFELWVTRLFEETGCRATHGKILKGTAVNHEIDVIAVKDGKLMLGECKFRNDVDAKIPVTTPMYFLSRFNDLKENEFEFFDQKLKPSSGWLITNAYLTSDAISFSDCYGIKLISWNYPEESSIKNRVDSKGIYPITCLTTLNKLQKSILLKEEIILVKDLLNSIDKVFGLVKLTNSQERKLLEEAKELVF
ncbi:MAG: ATP cone domain-containing protein [Flavobacteriaceae bacterium]